MASKVDFIEQLCYFTEEVTKNCLMPTAAQRDAPSENRVPNVYCMRVQDGHSATKKAPYILHQLIYTSDGQPTGHAAQSYATVRTVFCIYNQDESEGALMLLNLVERLRIAMLETRVIAKRYRLDASQNIETQIYHDDTAPYYMGEMITVWELPEVEWEVTKWLT